MAVGVDTCLAVRQTFKLEHLISGALHLLVQIVTHSNQSLFSPLQDRSNTKPVDSAHFLGAEWQWFASGLPRIARP